MPARKLSLVMAVLLILAGCAPGPTPEPSTTPEEPRPCFVFHIPKEQADQAHGYADALVAELILAVEDETGNSLCESGALYEAVPHPGSDNEVDFVHTRGVGIDSLVLVTGIDAETGKLAYDVFPPPDELSADMERDVESAPFSYHEDEGEFALDINRTDGTLIHYDLFYDSDLGWIWSRENASALKLSSGPVERRAIRIQPMASEVLGLDEIRNFVLALRDNPAIEAYDDEPREAWLGWSIGMYQDAAGENHLILVKEGLDEQGQTVAQQAF
ncbi:MAG: hypothetical protein ISS49_12010 [Anaerolineae bacterium]|nr:hypothetical protein [Anaerolineae bacterium]